MSAALRLGTFLLLAAQAGAADAPRAPEPRSRRLAAASAFGNGASPSEGSPEQGKPSNIHPRGSLRNSRLQFEKRKVGHVAFLGGSITEMNGFRPLVCDFLTRRFPETKFTFTNAGIASTCSTTGSFRLAADVLDKALA